MKDERDKDLVDFLTWVLSDPKRPMNGARIMAIILTIISASLMGLVAGTVVKQNVPVSTETLK